MWKTGKDIEQTLQTLNLFVDFTSTQSFYHNFIIDVCRQNSLMNYDFIAQIDTCPYFQQKSFTNLVNDM